MTVEHDGGKSGPENRAMAGSTTKQKVLRAKYLDWCSARLADSFLVLAPDEIYEMAERASHGHAVERLVAETVAHPSGVAADTFPRVQNSAAALPAADTESFRTLVALVTEVLAETLHLPSFETWAADYEKSPQKYDDELLGFWREAVTD